MEVPALDQGLRSILERSGDVYVQTDAAFTVTWVSGSVTARLGWEPEELRGHDLRDLVHPDDMPPGMYELETMTERLGELPHGTVRVRVRTRADGYRWTSWTVAPLLAEDGRVVGTFDALRDVDDLVRAQADVRAQEELLRATLDAEVDPHVRLVPVRDASGSIVDFEYVHANAAACAYNGLPRGDLVGKRLLDLLPGHVSSGLFEQYVQVVETGDTLVLDDFSYEVELRGGQRRWFDIRAVKVGDGLSYLWRDVTERHDAARALAQQQEQFRSAMDSASIGMALVAPDGRFLRVNPALCSLLGRDEATLLTCTWQELTHPDDLGSDIEPISELIAGVRAVYRHRKRYVRADGSIVWGDLSVSCVRDDDGQVLHQIAQIVDVTTEHEQYEALQAAQEQYRLLAENATDVVFRADARGVLTYCSDGVTRILGWTADQVVGHRDVDFVHPDDVLTATSPPLGPERDMVGPYRIRLRTGLGGYRWVEVTARNLRDASGVVTGRVGGWRDVDAEVTAEQALHRQASRDALTGLLNRAEVLGRLEAILGHRRRTGSGVALAFVDLDGLKSVNDARGHAAGDALLQASAARISAAVRDGDLVARIGGDELLVVLHGVGGLDDAVAVAEKMRAVVAQPVPTPNGPPVVSSASIGVTVARPGETVDQVIARADAAMYRVKRTGGNRVSVAP